MQTAASTSITTDTATPATMTMLLDKLSVWSGSVETAGSEDTPGAVDPPVAVDPSVAVDTVLRIDRLWYSYTVCF